MTPTCPFCEPARDRIFHEDPLVIALWDGFPVSPGHALIVPRRHVPTWFDANAEEQAAILGTIDRVREEILRRYQPDGFNIGINVGEAAGQTVFHLHLHVIPRYRGDVPNPRGGVRRVIPHRADYLATPPAGLDLVSTPPHTRPLIRGDADPLLPHLRSDLYRAFSADLVISFILRSGVRPIGEQLRDLLGRGWRLHILTGDYLDVSEPEVLLRPLRSRGLKRGAVLVLRPLQSGGAKGCGILKATWAPPLPASYGGRAASPLQSTPGLRAIRRTEQPATAPTAYTLLFPEIEHLDHNGRRYARWYETVSMHCASEWSISWIRSRFDPS